MLVSDLSSSLTIKLLHMSIVDPMGCSRCFHVTPFSKLSITAPFEAKKNCLV
jgi:hypothetical protein